MAPDSVSLGNLLLAREREGIGPLAGQMREAVMQVLGCLAHHECVRVHQPLSDKARVRVDAFAHRV